MSNEYVTMQGKAYTFVLQHAKLRISIFALLLVYGKIKGRTIFFTLFLIYSSNMYLCMLNHPGVVSFMLD